MEVEFTYCKTKHRPLTKYFSIIVLSIFSPALLNHSCDPNVIALFDGPRMRLRTNRKISENEQASLKNTLFRIIFLFFQLFVSYTDLLETRARRQRHLQKYYLFSCNCPRCSSEFCGSLDEKLIQTAAGK